MNYDKFEHELSEKLIQAGWILSRDSDRQGTYITWSELGATHKATFIEDVNKLFPCQTDELKKLLLEFGIRHEMVELSKLEKFKRQASWMIGDGPFLLVTCDSRGQADYSLFQSKDDEAASQAMYAAADAGKEVVVVEMRFLRETKVPRLFPFGARGYWVPDDVPKPGSGGELLWHRPPPPDAGS
ncbi:hypothetical protein EPO15_05175 [bacterium]|nr:MAG: hypothetical protein EPO15_05175 [bacterium]